MVGTSGSAAERVVLSTASARMVPSVTNGTEGASTTKAIGVWPPSVDCSACPELLNGTATRSSPSEWRKISPDRCGVVPAPEWAKLYLPGLARTRSTSSCTVCTGSAGLTASRFGA